MMFPPYVYTVQLGSVAAHVYISKNTASGVDLDQEAEGVLL